MPFFGQAAFGKDFAGLGEQRGQVFIAGGEVTQDELPGTGVSGGLAEIPTQSDPPVLFST